MKSSLLSVSTRMGKRKRGEAAPESTTEIALEEKSASKFANPASSSSALPVSTGNVCPYLDTIDRTALDFDMERVCSVTLDNNHVYVCLVCGKFLQGRGVSTPCHTHSVQHGHFVFMNLDTRKIYCVPDDYEVRDKSLEDIKLYLSPQFSSDEIAGIDTSTRFSADVHGGTFRPGFVGLNNLGATDNINAVVQGLAHVQEFRDFCLQLGSSRNIAGTPSVQKSLLVNLVDCVRKMWSPINFKGVISPQTLVKVLGQASHGKFASGLSPDASGSTIDLLRFLLSYIHAAFLNPNLGIGGEAIQNSKSTVISECFQGVVQVTETINNKSDNTKQTKVKSVPFNYLSLDIPPTPLFRESEGGRIVPNIPIHQLLEKFNGRKPAEQFTQAAHTSRRFRILKLPKYVILNCDRKETQNFSKRGRNCTVVAFPVSSLEFCSVCGVHEDHFNCPASMDIDSLGENEVKAVVDNFCTLVPACKPFVVSNAYTQAAREIAKACDVKKYDLVANICQSSSATASADSEVDVASSTVGGVPLKKKGQGGVNGSGALHNKNKVHVQNLSTSQWYEMEDLEVKEIETRAIGVCEADILIYKRQ